MNNVDYKAMLYEKMNNGVILIIPKCLWEYF